MDRNTLGYLGILFLSCGTAGDLNSTFTTSGLPDQPSTPPSLIDGGSFDSTSTPPPDPTICARKTYTAQQRPIDVMLVLDNSHSMADEILKVQQNIPNFLSKIEALQGRLLVLSSKGRNVLDVRENVPNLFGSSLMGDVPLQFCGPVPPAMENCQDRPGRYYHLDPFPYGVASTNSLSLLLGTYPESYRWPGSIVGPDGGGWGRWLREGSFRFLINVTDDDAQYPRPQDGLETYQVFDRSLTGLPGFLTNGVRQYSYNAIFGKVPLGGATYGPSGGCRSTEGPFNFAMSPGLQHERLATLTGGNAESICRTDWSPIFEGLADKALEQVPCRYDLQGLDPNRLVLKAPTVLPRVAVKDDCGDGWWFDDTSVTLCDRTCDDVRNQGASVLFEVPCPGETLK